MFIFNTGENHLRILNFYSMKKLFTLTVLFSCLQLLPAKSIAQSLTFDIPEYTYYTSKQLTQKVFETLNHARTQPLDFLQKYRSELEKGQPKFIRILETSAPLNSILWDEGLAEMARVKVIQHNLNPDDIAHHKN